MSAANFPPPHTNTGAKQNVTASSSTVAQDPQLSATVGKIKALPLPVPSVPPSATLSGEALLPPPGFEGTLCDATRKRAVTPSPGHLKSAILPPNSGISNTNPSLSLALRDARASPFDRRCLLRGPSTVKPSPASAGTQAAPIPSAPNPSTALSMLPPLPSGSGLTSSDPHLGFSFTFSPAAPGTDPLRMPAQPAGQLVYAPSNAPPEARLTSAAPGLSTVGLSQQTAAAMYPHPMAFITTPLASGSGSALSHPPGAGLSPPLATAAASTSGNGSALLRPLGPGLSHPPMPTAAASANGTPAALSAPSGAASASGTAANVNLSPLSSFGIDFRAATGAQKNEGKNYLIEEHLKIIRSHMAALKAPVMSADFKNAYFKLIMHRAHVHMLAFYEYSPFASPVWDEISYIGYLISKSPENIQLRELLYMRAQQTQEKPWERLLVKAISNLSEMELQYERENIPVSDKIGAHPLLSCPTYHCDQQNPLFFLLPHLPFQTTYQGQVHRLDPKYASDSFNTDAPTDLRLFRHAIHFKYKEYWTGLEVYYRTTHGALLLLNKTAATLEDQLSKQANPTISPTERRQLYLSSLSNLALRSLIFQCASGTVEVCLANCDYHNTTDPEKEKVLLTKVNDLFRKLLSSETGKKHLEKAKATFQAMVESYAQREKHVPAKK